jgi:hypothetical protein
VFHIHVLNLKKRIKNVFAFCAISHFISFQEPNRKETSNVFLQILRSSFFLFFILIKAAENEVARLGSSLLPPLRKGEEGRPPEKLDTPLLVLIDQSTDHK